MANAETSVISFVNPVCEIASDDLHLDDECVVSIDNDPENKANGTVAYTAQVSGNGTTNPAYKQGPGMAPKPNGEISPNNADSISMNSPERKLFRQNSMKQNSLPHRVKFTRSQLVSKPCVAGVALLVVLLVAILVAIYFVVGRNKELSQQPAAVKCRAVEGVLKIINEEFSEDLSHPASPLYASFSFNVHSTLDLIMSKSSLSGVYNNTYVTGFSNGSIIVNFVITLTELYDMNSLKSMMQEAIASKSLFHPSNSKRFYLGESHYLVDMSSLGFQGIPVTNELPLKNLFPTSSTISPSDKETVTSAVVTQSSSSSSLLSSPAQSAQTSASQATARLTETSTSVFEGPEVRLVDGADELSGRLEIFYQGAWGTVCRNLFDQNSARVFCTMLGLSGGQYEYQRYGRGTGPVVLDNVACSEHAQSLSDCSHGVWGQSTCSHLNDVSISCSPAPQSTPPTTVLIPELKVRLVGGPNERRGRIEVWHDNVWGTVCNDLFDDREASVFCRMMGFNGTSVYLHELYGPGSEESPVWLDDVQCEGSESHVDECTHAGWHEAFCEHAEDVSIACNTELEVTTTSAAVTTVVTSPGLSQSVTSASLTTQIPEVEVRLVGGPTSSEGRIEVKHNGQWGTVCDDWFGDEDAKVFCVMMGFSGEAEYLYSQYGPGDDGMPIWLDNMDCSGTETHIEECDHEGWGGHMCRHREDVSISCQGQGSVASMSPVTMATTLAEEVEVRLVGGPTSSEGRIEVKHNGQWGTVCDDWFGDEDAKVFCVMMGFSGEAEYLYSQYGPGDDGMPIWLDNMDCSGTETHIEECDHEGWGGHMCRHREDVSISCQGQGSVASMSPVTMATTQAEEVEVRLVGGPTSSEGRIEVKHNGQWGTVCDDWFGDEDAKVFCVMMGFSGEAEYLYSQYGPGDDGMPIWLDNMDCSGTETHIEECDHEGWGGHMCRHREDVSISCQDQGFTTVQSSLQEVEVRLVGGPTSSEGRIEVKHNGQWGTVCDDWFGDEDAKVFCVMMGFSGEAEYLYSQYGPGDDGMPIWLDNMDCSGTETHIEECDHEGWGGHNCRHREDVSISCQRPESTSLSDITTTAAQLP